MSELDLFLGKSGRLCRILLGALCIAFVAVWPFSFSFAQTSVYHPFPDSNAVWGMTAGCTDWNCGIYRYVQNYYSGDSIIDGNLYKIIQEELSMEFGGCGCGIPEDIGSGYLREDTAAHKVYWRIPGMGSDTLLYDFTLAIGDTLRGLYGNSGLCAESIFIVQTIDSVQVGSSYRKRINFSNIDLDPCNSTSIIEGVGSTTGLTACYATPASFGMLLTCFRVDGELLYTAPCGVPDPVACGELPLSIMGAHPKATTPTVVIHPNPSPGIFTLQLFTGHATLKELQLFTLQGRAVPVEMATRGSPHEISVSVHAPAGLYALQIRFADGPTQFAKVVLRP